MRHENWFCRFAIGVLIVQPGFAQDGKKSSGGEQKRSISVCVAMTQNRSGREVNPDWERDQLVRELKRLGTNRKSKIVLEAVAMDAAEREDASVEAEKKNCQYFVLTTVMNPSRGPGISNGPDGVGRAPIVLGNNKLSQTMAMNFSLIEVGSARTVAEGTATAPVEGNNETRAADDTMRFVAHRVASELRSGGPAIE